MELYCKFRLCATHHVVSSTPNPPPPQQIDRLDREKPASLPKWKKKKERNIPSDARSKLIMNKLCHLTLLVQSYIPRIYGGNKPQRHAKRGEGKKKTFKILVTGNKYPNIEGIRRPFGQFSPKLPLLTVYTGLQWMSYL